MYNLTTSVWHLHLFVIRSIRLPITLKGLDTLFGACTILPRLEYKVQVFKLLVGISRDHTRSDDQEYKMDQYSDWTFSSSTLDIREMNRLALKTYCKTLSSVSAAWFSSYVELSASLPCGPPPVLLQKGVMRGAEDYFSRHKTQRPSHELKQKPGKLSIYHLFIY